MLYSGLGLFLMALVFFALDFFRVTPGAAGLANLALIASLILLAGAVWSSPHGRHLRDRHLRYRH